MKKSSSLLNAFAFTAAILAIWPAYAAPEDAKRAEQSLQSDGPMQQPAEKPAKRQFYRHRHARPAESGTGAKSDAGSASATAEFNPGSLKSAKPGEVPDLKSAPSPRQTGQRGARLKSRIAKQSKSRTGRTRKSKNTMTV